MVLYVQEISVHSTRSLTWNLFVLDMSPIFSTILWAVFAIQSTIGAPALFSTRGIGETELYMSPSTSHSLRPEVVRRQNSWAGKALWGAIQGGFNAGITMLQDKISDELTGNDRDHPQKSKQQLEEERRKKEQEEQEAERKKKTEEEEENSWGRWELRRGKMPGTLEGKDRHVLLLTTLSR